MNYSSKVSLLLLLAASLLNLSMGLTTYSYIRVEIDPDYSSIKANCPNAFQTGLQSQIQGWINDGVALYFGQRNDQIVPYNLTYLAGWDGQWNKHRNLEEQVSKEPANKLRSRAQVETLERKLCSKSTCYQCCSVACIVYCGCYLCGKSRRELDYSAMNAWSLSANDEVGIVVQVLASKWISEYDTTGCMGNPWKASVMVTFVK